MRTALLASILRGFGSNAFSLPDPNQAYRIELYDGNMPGETTPIFWDPHALGLKAVALMAAGGPGGAGNVTGGSGGSGSAGEGSVNELFTFLAGDLYGLFFQPVDRGSPGRTDGSTPVRAPNSTLTIVNPVTGNRTYTWLSGLPGSNATGANGGAGGAAPGGEAGAPAGGTSGSKNGANGADLRATAGTRGMAHRPGAPGGGGGYWLTATGTGGSGGNGGPRGSSGDGTQFGLGGGAGGAGGPGGGCGWSENYMSTGNVTGMAWRTNDGLNFPAISMWGAGGLGGPSGWDGRVGGPPFAIFEQYFGANTPAYPDLGQEMLPVANPAAGSTPTPLTVARDFLGSHQAYWPTTGYFGASPSLHSAPSFQHYATRTINWGQAPGLDDSSVQRGVGSILNSFQMKTPTGPALNPTNATWTWLDGRTSALQTLGWTGFVTLFGVADFNRTTTDLDPYGCRSRSTPSIYSLHQNSWQTYATRYPYGTFATKAENWNEPDTTSFSVVGGTPMRTLVDITKAARDGLHAADSRWKVYATGHIGALHGPNGLGTYLRANGVVNTGVKGWQITDGLSTHLYQCAQEYPFGDIRRQQGGAGILSHPEWGWINLRAAFFEASAGQGTRFINSESGYSTLFYNSTLYPTAAHRYEAQAGLYFEHLVRPCDGYYIFTGCAFDENDTEFGDYKNKSWGPAQALDDIQQFVLAAGTQVTSIRRQSNGAYRVVRSDGQVRRFDRTYGATRL